MKPKFFWLLLPILVLGMATWRIKIVADSWRPTRFAAAGDARELLFSPDGRYVIATHYGAAEVIDLYSNGHSRFESLGYDWAFLPRGNRIMGRWSENLEDKDVQLEFRNFPSSTLERRLTFPFTGSMDEEGLTVPTLVDNEIRCASRERFYRWRLSGKKPKLSSTSLRIKDRFLLRASFSAEGRKLILLYEEDNDVSHGSWIRVLDAGTRKLTRSIRLPSVQATEEAKLSDTGNLLAATEIINGQIHFIDLGSGRELWHTHAAPFLFTGDGRLAVIVSSDTKKCLEVRNARTGQLMRETVPFPHKINNLVALGPEGRWAYAQIGERIYRVRIQ